MPHLTCADSKKPIQLTEQIAVSGEGKVWKTEKQGILAKVYNLATLERADKLSLMVANKPSDPNDHKNHISFAWPQSLLTNDANQIVGFLMPQIVGGREIIEIYSPTKRKQLKLGVDWRFLHVVATNIAQIVWAIHDKGYVIGDIKPQNILVNNTALISIIDTDSFQVRDPLHGKIHHCLVGSQGFTPPELLGKDLSSTIQTSSHDHFRLGVIIYYLLFGSHPFGGKWTGTGESPMQDDLIKNGWWPYAKNSPIQPGRNTINLEIIHPEVKECFLKCFNEGHLNPALRPTAETWYYALQKAYSDLTICDDIDSHIYRRSYQKCSWCERKLSLGVDIFEFTGTISNNSGTKIFSSEQITELIAQNGNNLIVVGKVTSVMVFLNNIFINFNFGQIELNKSFACVMELDKLQEFSIVQPFYQNLTSIKNQWIKVTGKIFIYRHQSKNIIKPEINIENPNQITIISEPIAKSLISSNISTVTSPVKQSPYPLNQTPTTNQTSASPTTTPRPIATPVTPIVQSPSQPVTTPVTSKTRPSPTTPVKTQSKGILGRIFALPKWVLVSSLILSVVAPTIYIVLNNNTSDKEYNKRGLTRVNLGDNKGAIEDYNQALRLNPNDANAYNNRGISRKNLGDNQGAIEDYNQALSLNPNDAEAYNNRGVSRHNLGDNQGAIEDYNQALSLNPNYADAYNNRGISRDNLKDYNGAIEDYNQALRLKPNYADAYNNRGVSRMNLGDNQGAIEDYNQALRLKPNYADAYNNRGVSRMNLGDNQGAIEDYNQALRINPNVANAFNNREIARRSHTFPNN